MIVKVDTIRKCLLHHEDSDKSFVSFYIDFEQS